MYKMVNLSINEVELQSEIIKTKIDNLIYEEKERFFSIYNKSIKDEAMYIKLGMIFFLGLHHIYLKDYEKLFKTIVIFSLSCYALSFGYFVISVLLIVLLVLLDINSIFKSENIVKEYNNKLAINILERIENR